MTYNDVTRCSMNEKPAVYNPHNSGSTQINGLELFFVAPEASDSLSEFNPIIILGGTLSYVEVGPKQDAELARREREIFNALEKGNLVCITFVDDPLVLRVLGRIGVNLDTWEKPQVDLVVKRSEFSSFLKRFGGTNIFFNPKANVTLDDIICKTTGEALVGFSKKVGKGILVFLPIYIPYVRFNDFDFVSKFLSTLLSALDTYLPRIHYKPPDWISSYRFPQENALVSEVEEFQKEISKREKSLDRYWKLKEVLWFRNNELVEAIMDFFKQVGIKTRRDEIEEEDFWIREGNKETVVVEVKGLDRNLKRQHISQLDEHRAAREKPDDFPALLVVNSFSKAKSLKEKDEDIPPNVVKKAVKTSVLIIRTLDLCNAYYLIERKKLKPETLLKSIRNETGWLKVTTSACRIKK